MNRHYGYVYLAGPIAGSTYADAVEWRAAVSARLAPGITALSPMRGKGQLAGNKGKLGGFYPSDDPMTTPAGIVARDFADVKRCDLVLMNLLGAESVSIGTMVELGWASALGKPVIVAWDGGVHVLRNPHYHPFVHQIASFRVGSLDEAIRVANSFLLPDPQWENNRLAHLSEKAADLAA